MLPDQDYNPSQWNHLKGLTWADPKFYARGNVDILLGMDVIVEIMKSGFVKGQEGQPIAQETKIGWIMSGKIDRQWQSQAVKCLVSTLDKREDCEEKIDLTKFWEIEELHPEREMTAAEQECENFYTSTIKKDTDGKYIAKIPFKADMGPETLGNSRGSAWLDSCSWKKRFAQDPTLKEEYTKVIREYLSLGHMKEVTKLSPEKKLYFIPHHAVVKPDSLTTKLKRSNSLENAIKEKDEVIKALQSEE
ncbi:uncharacterized protein LOC119083964 [Bradysia coprophila]|uniref:uncharacterized protein LOC119083964 n=1 Tax=Bradysia coprophila TaxID=38358 RepID=UPI00187DCA8E|nr:uncharacterized protein LOC119083964 [Bradysia coprophila]